MIWNRWGDHLVEECCDHVWGRSVLLFPHGVLFEVSPRLYVKWTVKERTKRKCWAKRSQVGPHPLPLPCQPNDLLSRVPSSPRRAVLTLLPRVVVLPWFTKQQICFTFSLCWWYRAIQIVLVSLWLIFWDISLWDLTIEVKNDVERIKKHYFSTTVPRLLLHNPQNMWDYFLW